MPFTFWYVVPLVPFPDSVLVTNPKTNLIELQSLFFTKADSLGLVDSKPRYLVLEFAHRTRGANRAAGFEKEFQDFEAVLPLANGQAEFDHAALLSPTQR